MDKRALLACGWASSLLYVATDTIGALLWPGYLYKSQTISELAAIEAPSRLAVVPMFLAYDGLVIAFGLAIAALSYRTSALRRTGRLLVAIGAVGLAGALFPMHLRGMDQGFTGIMHLVFTAVTVALIVAAMLSASGSFGRAFRAYSLVSVAALLGFGLFAAIAAPRVALGLETPMAGLAERASVGAYLLWVAVLSLRLARAESRTESLEELVAEAGA